MKAKVLGTALFAAIAVGGIGYCPVPWAPALLTAAAMSTVVAWRATRVGRKVVMANLAAVLVALAAFEGYLGYEGARGDGTRMEGTITDGFTHPDDVLGYAPDPGKRVTARKLHGNTVLYDVAYTIGTDGLRVTPSAPGTPVSRCVIFFGDSVSFGEGVNDDESFASRVARDPKGSSTVHNFAFSGYGPHQMLAALQSSLVERTSTCNPTHVFYLGILEHIPRVAGLASWDRHGPRFRLDGHGALARDGNFDGVTGTDKRLLWSAWLGAPLARYLTWQRFFGHSRDPTDADLDLYVAIMLESARIMRQRFPESAFQMFLWDGRDDARIGVIERRLTAGGIHVHRLTTVIPDFAANSERYLLGPHDGHPNPLMHERIAEYISGNLAVR